MPPLEWFLKVYKIPEKTDEDYKVRMEFLIWYLDEWLPAAAGFESFKPDIRYYRKIVDTKVLKSGEKVPHVTKESEAFAIVLYMNCMTKWSKIIPKKIQDPGWKIPPCDEKDKTTYEHNNTRWSDGRSGQVKGGGWAPEAHDELTKHIERIYAIRKNDKATKWSLFTELLRLLREAKDITGEGPSKKRKRKSKVVVERVYNEVVELSDVECSDSDDEDSVSG